MRHTCVVPAVALILAIACGGEVPTAPGNSPPEVATVRLSNLPDNMVVGGQVTVEAVLKDVSGEILLGQFITWKSSDPSVARIAPMWQGAAQLTAVGTGATWIRLNVGRIESSFRVDVRP